MAPIIEKFVIDNPDIKYTKIDVDEQSSLIYKYNVRTVPTFIALIDGEFHNRLFGVNQESDIKSIFG